MKKRIPILLALTISIVMLGGVASAGAGPARKVTGGYQYSLPWLQVHGWVEVKVHEVAPGKAKGKMQEQIYSETQGWWLWKGHPICIAFGEADGAPAAAIVIQIDRTRGWGEVEAGQYFKFWLSDGGTPATEGDKAGLLVWPPQVGQPNCDYEEAAFASPLDAGNVVIHHYP